MIQHFSAEDGCRIAYRLEGPAGAPVLLLSNSLGTTLAMWDAQMEALTKTYRVLRYDSRGHGDSDAPPGAYSLDRLGRDAVALLDHVKLERVRFCGLSKGGMVGQWLAARAAERLEKLVLCNTAAYMGPPSAWQQRIDLVMKDGMVAVTDAVIGRWFTEDFLNAAPEKIAPVRSMLLATKPGGYAGCCAAIRDMDLRVIGSLNKTPTLVIAGLRDPATPPDKSEAIVKAAQDARLVLLDAAHLSNIEQTEAFTHALTDFLE